MKPILVRAVSLLSLVLPVAVRAQEVGYPADLAYAAHVSTNPVPSGDAGWGLLESEPRPVTESWILAARPVLFARHTLGEVRFDELAIAEHDEHGGFLRDVMRVDLGSLEGWTRTGPGLAGEGLEGGRGYLSISGPGETWLCRKSLRFPVVVGRAYSIRGIARGLDVAAGGGVEGGFGLIFEFSPSGEGLDLSGDAGADEPAQDVPAEPVPPASEILPVLLVLAPRDFYYREYAEPRAELEAAGLRVVVAAATTDPVVPHPGTGQGEDGGIVRPDLALADVRSIDYGAIVFVGGWGPSAYQYAFPGEYVEPVYRGDPALKAIVNELVVAFDREEKILAAICYGVTVLAWARIDGRSPLAGRTVVGGPIGSPAVTVDGIYHDWFALPTAWHVEANGGIQLPPNSIGDPSTPDDDVLSDGRILTAQDYDAGARFGQVLAERLLAR